MFAFIQETNAQVATLSDTATGKGVSHWDKGIWPNGNPAIRGPWDAIDDAQALATVAINNDLANIRMNAWLLGLPIAERLGEREWIQNWNEGPAGEAPNPIMGFYRQDIEIDYIPWIIVPGGPFGPLIQ